MSFEEDVYVNVLHALACEHARRNSIPHSHVFTREQYRANSEDVRSIRLGVEREAKS